MFILRNIKYNMFLCNFGKRTGIFCVQGKIKLALNFDLKTFLIAKGHNSQIYMLMFLQY